MTNDGEIAAVTTSLDDRLGDGTEITNVERLEHDNLWAGVGSTWNVTLSKSKQVVMQTKEVYGTAPMR